MDELVSTISQKVGISKDQAKQAVEAVIHFLEEKLPKPIGSQVRATLTGNAAVVGQVVDKAAELAKGVPGLGGLLGGKKE